MAGLQQPLPLNHPPPPPTSQPPRKKLRPRNAQPKLTIQQITDNEVVQSALRVGRRARANAPKPGQQPKALDDLLNRMAAWARNVAPEYSLAEFVVAAQRIAGNRELRPMLGVFRLAELRDVTGDDPDDLKKEPSDPQQEDKPEQLVADPAAPIRADVGPVEADVGPEDDDWDDLNVVPDGVIETRPVPTAQAQSPVRKDDAQQRQQLSPEVEARIERNRLAAIERRKQTMTRLGEENQTANQNEENSTSPHESKALAESTSCIQVDGSSQQALESEKNATEMGRDQHPTKPTKTNSEEERPSLKTSDSKCVSSEKGTESYQKPKPADEDRVKMLIRVLAEGEESAVPTVENKSSVNKRDSVMKDRALTESDSLKRDPQTMRDPEKIEERIRNNDEGLRPTEPNQDKRNDKKDIPNLKESTQTLGASNDSNDDDIDMEIMAEFEAGDEI